MRLFLFTFLLLKIFSPAYGNTIYYLTKIPNLQVYDLTASNGIKYLKAEKSFKVGIVKNNVQCNKPSENNIKNKFNLIKSNLEKYEKNFLEKINLKYVVLCENLKVSDIRTAGVPNHKVKTLIIDIKSDPRYFERSIHHELFHMADESYDNLFSYEEWEKFNIPSFQCTIGDQISLSPRSKFCSNIEFTQVSTPKYLERVINDQNTQCVGLVKQIPDRTDIDLVINELFVIEYYSR